MSPEKTKVINWSKWHPKLTAVERMLVEFCEPCELLRPNNYLDPVCHRQGSNRMSHVYAALNVRKCRFPIVGGKPGVVDKGIFTPNEG